MKMKSLFLIIAILAFVSIGAQAQVPFAGGVTGSVTVNCVPKATVANTIATTKICSDGTTTTINTNKFTVTEASGNTAVAGTLIVTGLTTFSGGVANTGTLTNTGVLAIVSPSASSLAVGLAGATNPAFVVDSSTASQAAGLSVTGAATGGTVAVAAIDSGSATNLTLNAKGTGTIGIGSVSTGAVTITPATNITGALIVTGTINGPSGATISTATPVVLTAAMSGRLFVSNSTADAVQVFTLPPASTAGLVFCFSLGSSSLGSNREVDVEPQGASDLIIGTTTAAGGTGIVTTAGPGHGVKNTHATAVRGNQVCVQSDGVNTYYQRSLSGTWAAY